MNQAESFHAMNRAADERKAWQRLLAEHPSSVYAARARAIEPTTVVVLDGAHMLAAAERNPDFGYDLMKRVAQLAVQRLQAARRQLVSLENKVEFDL